jgi:hypothetical protein
MFWRRRTLKEVAAIYDIPDDPRTLTDQQLRDYLKNWENIDYKVLTCLCAEALRRTIKVY